MITLKICPMVMMALVSTLAEAVYAQEAPLTPAPAAAQAAAPSSPAAAPTSSNAPPAKTPATTTAATTPAGPSPEILKKARQNGYQVKVRRGTTYFCKTAAALGTRFVDEKCFNQDQLESALERDQTQRDSLQQNVCTGGGACGGGK